MLVNFSLRPLQLCFANLDGGNYDATLLLKVGQIVISAEVSEPATLSELVTRPQSRIMIMVV